MSETPFLNKILAFTARTPEASLPGPIGRPGGPGPWRHKDMMRPPYIQDAAHHLIGKYGESNADRCSPTGLPGDPAQPAGGEARPSARHRQRAERSGRG